MDEMQYVRWLRPEPSEPSWHALLAGRNLLTAGQRGRRGSRLAARLRPRNLGFPRAATIGGLGFSLAAGLVISQTVSLGGSDGGGNPPESAYAAVILTRAAAAAEKEQPPRHRGDFAYVEYKSTESGIPRTHRSHVWMWRSLDGSRQGLYREYSTPPESASGNLEQLPLPPNRNPNLGEPTYAFLRSLPDDPDAMLRKIRHECRKVRGSKPPKVVAKSGKDKVIPRGQGEVIRMRDRCDWHTAFEMINGIVAQHVVPPDVRATLFEATAEVPGITVVENAELPATGERGVAVGLTFAGAREELIFDPDTYEFLGSRHVAVTDSGPHDAGTVLTSMALLEKGFVDRVGEPL